MLPFNFAASIFRVTRLRIWSAGHTPMIGETVRTCGILGKKGLIKGVVKIRARES